MATKPAAYNPRLHYPGSPYGDINGENVGTNTLSPEYADQPGYGGQAASGSPTGIWAGGDADTLDPRYAGVPGYGGRAGAGRAVQTTGAFQYQPRDANGGINLDPAYINSWLDAVDQERIRTGRGPMSPQERQEAYGYATRPDTYTGGGVYQGPNAYLFDRLTNPNSMSASGVRPDQANLIGQEQGGGTLGSLSGGVLGSPLMRGYEKPFQGTDINSILNSEAFQAANREGLNSINRMASARGTLHTGGTLKDLAGFTNSLALGAINDQFSRDLAQSGFNRDTLWGDTDRQFGRLADFTRLGLAGSQQLAANSSVYGQTPGMTPGNGPSSGPYAPPDPTNPVRWQPYRR